MKDFKIKSHPLSHQVKAWIDWCCENGVPPNIQVSTAHPGLDCAFKTKFSETIAFSLTASAIRNLVIDPTVMHFNCTHGGKGYHVSIDYDAIIGFGSPRLTISGMPFIYPGLPVTEMAYHDIQQGVKSEPLQLELPSTEVHAPVKGAGWKPQLVGGTDVS